MVVLYILGSCDAFSQITENVLCKTFIIVGLRFIFTPISLSL
jgi:hypothetical protein